MSGWSNAKETDIIEGIDSGNRWDITNVTTSQYESFTLNSTGRGWVDVSGWTKLGLREGHDIEDQAIQTGALVTSGVNIAMSEYAGTTRDPKLEVTYTLPGNAGIMTTWGGFWGPTY